MSLTDNSGKTFPVRDHPTCVWCVTTGKDDTIELLGDAATGSRRTMTLRILEVCTCETDCLIGFCKHDALTTEDLNSE